MHIDTNCVRYTIQNSIYKASPTRRIRRLISNHLTNRVMWEIFNCKT